MDNKSIVALFEENELNIAALYAIYGQKIPKKFSFWNRLSVEEIGHAANISSNKETIGDITETKFSRGVVNYVMSFVLDEIEKAEKGDITHRDALCAALRIERSMLEKKCFDFFVPTNETVKNIFLKLNSETEMHVEELLKEMKKNKFTLEEMR